MDTTKLVHLPPNVRQLLDASQKVCEGWGGNVDDTDAAIKDLRKVLCSFAMGDKRQTHRKDVRQRGPI